MRLVLIAQIIFLTVFVSCSHQNSKNQDLANVENESSHNVVESEEYWVKYYPKTFPFFAGGTPIQIDMSKYSDSLQNLHPVMFAYDMTQEELRDIVKGALDKYGWEYHLVVDEFPTLVYRFTTSKDEARVMASVMNLGGMVVLQVTDITN